MTGGENPRPGRQFKTWHICIVEDLREFRVTEGSTKHSPLVFEFEPGLWSTATKKVGKWYRGLLQAAERLTRTPHPTPDHARICSHWHIP